MPLNRTIIHLHELIERHRSAPPPRAAARLETGIATLDETLEGGLPKGALVEIVSVLPGGGASSLLVSLLRKSAAASRWSALIDGHDNFDPASAGEAVLSCLLWVRCRTADEALRSADLLLRDGNLPLVVLDLRGNAEAELRRIPTPQWYRLQRAIEPTGLAGLILTPRPMIPCAQARLLLENRPGLAALDDEQEIIVRTLRMELTRNRAAMIQEDLAQAG